MENTRYQLVLSKIFVIVVIVAEGLTFKTQE